MAVEALHQRRVVEHDHDEATIVELIGHDIRRHLTRPRRLAGGRRPHRIGHINRRKGDELLRLAVFEHSEVFGFQSLDGHAVPVEHGHVELNDIDARAKDGWVLGRCLSRKQGERLRARNRDDAEHDNADQRVPRCLRRLRRHGQLEVCGCLANRSRAITTKATKDGLARIPSSPKSWSSFVIFVFFVVIALPPVTKAL
jgi:hypothetical protein